MTHTRIRGLLAVLFAVIFCAASFPARTVSAANEDGGYAITGYTIVDNGDGTVVLSEITARAESDQETQLYIAVYNEADRLVNLIEEDITTAGETVLEPELTYDKSDTVKVFWWKELIPLMDVYTLDNEHKDPAATASPALLRDAHGYRDGNGFSYARAYADGYTGSGADVHGACGVG